MKKDNSYMNSISDALFYHSSFVGFYFHLTSLNRTDRKKNSFLSSSLVTEFYIIN